MQRKPIGDSKSGLSLHIEQTPFVMTLESHPDPLLLIVVLAALLSVGIINGVATSPRDGLLSLVLFVFLFLPLISVLGFNAVRVKTLCVLDKEQMVLRIDERSYTRRIREQFGLEEVQAVFVRRLPGAPLTGDALTHGVFIELAAADYLVASSTNEQAIGQDAWRISRFLGIPLNMAAPDPVPPARKRTGVLLTACLLYLLPLVLAISVLFFLLDQLPRVAAPSLVGLLAAVVISQIGAILAYAYYRARRPYDG